MKYLKLSASLLFSLLLVWALNRSWTLPGSPVGLPPLGKFFSPFAGFWQNAEPLDGYASFELPLEGLKAEAEVVYDERLVPHIFAANPEDAFFLQGYVTAQLRLWQMDVSTRRAAGRLSEIMGPRTLEMDRQQRRRGIFLAAERAARAWEKSEHFPLLDAYVRGVNAYIEQLEPSDYPLEFKLLDYAPEPWTTVHVALMLKNMASTLCAHEDDLEATNALQFFGDSLFQVLYPEYNPRQSPVIPAGTTWDFTPLALPDSPLVKASLDGLLSFQPLEKPDPGIGSNNWAVSPAKTANGKPILCSDPHLNFSLPAIWLELQMSWPQAKVYGVSIPGIPGILIGFNEHIAWGETNVGQDVLDWYRIHWADPARDSYWFDGQRRPVQKIVERIEVKGAETVFDTVRYTVHGPVVYEDPEHPYQDLAMRWIALDEPNPEEISVFYRLAEARNFEDYSQALLHYDLPAQNFAFACKDGDIAIKVNGKFPLKHPQQGRFVQDGSTSATLWHGWIPKSHVPQVKNPPRGFIASANQHSTAPDYPYYYNGAAFDDYRGRFLNRSLENMDSITVEDMMQLQTSNYSLQPEEVLPVLLPYLDTSRLSALQKRLVQLLRQWNYRFDADRVEPVLFTEWWQQLRRLAWDEMYALSDSLPILIPEDWRTLELLEQQPDFPLFDFQETPQRETAPDLVLMAFQRMSEELRERLDDPDFDWAAWKSTDVIHLSQIPAFSVLDLDVGGYRQALNAVRRRGGPSWRMVVELGDTVRAWGVYPAGQAGNPGSPFYSNLIETWTKGEYFPLNFMRSPDEGGEEVLFRASFRPR